MAFDFFKKKVKPKNPEPQAAEPTVPAVTTIAMAAPAGAVLKRFFISEKSTRGMAMNQYTFEVAKSATKTQVRDAVERAYKVDVEAVDTVRLPPKQRTLGRHRGTKPGLKKAIVTLRAGQTIAQAQP